MPEGITYRDLWRWITKEVRNTQYLRLALFPQHGQTTAKDPTLRKVKGAANKKAKDGNSLDAFLPILGISPSSSSAITKP